MDEKTVWSIRGSEILVKKDLDFTASHDQQWQLLTSDDAPLPFAIDEYRMHDYAACPERGGLARVYDADQPEPEGWEWRPLRAAITGLPEESWRGAARAMAFLNWRRVTKFCGRCGGRNSDLSTEPARQCEVCGALTYPRVSPAILVAVIRDGKLLLARNALNTTGTWSVLAGFVEPGESFEECAQREIREEVGIEVSIEKYLGSQPWPFPDQLMLGFSASWKSGELKPDQKEIAEADWFAPDDHPPIPMKGSLSRRVIDMAFEKILAMKT